MNIEADQLMLLRNNYKNHRSKTQVAIDKATGIVIECHDRGMGRETFYAVKDGKPIAYCAGHRQKTIRFLIRSTFVDQAYRRQGIGGILYRGILEHCETLVSDFELSEGARGLWAHLSRDESLKVRKVGNHYVAKSRKTKTKENCNA